ncbi:MAG: dihydropteroate synthase [Bradymonadaceae bacterium]|nr:dihydropteroate synthase [Lujinxingiaceae bacterium]
MSASIALACPRPIPAPVRLSERSLSFGKRCYVMGIVNVTPDSFSDGGAYLTHDAALAHALMLAEAGADIVDIGGESTRPGAKPVAVDEELERVVAVIEGLRARSPVLISVDTYKAAVASAALAAGADIINDISALGFDTDMAAVVASSGAALVMMHMRKTPADMQEDIVYDDLVDDVLDFFRERLARADAAGIAREQIILDPGIGFGKTVDQNYRLLRELGRFTELGRPILLGTSRKRFLGAIVGKPANDRVWATAATVACGIWAGADIVRVHDVAQMVDVARVAEAIAAMSFQDQATPF